MNVLILVCNIFYSMAGSYMRFFSGCFQGGLTATDVFAVEWIQTGAIHFGMTVTYFGFISDGNSLALYVSLISILHMKC